MIQRLLAFLIVVATFSFADAASANDSRPSYFQKDSVYAEQYAALTQVDFDGYYENLIKTENETIKNSTIVIIRLTIAKLIS